MEQNFWDISVSIRKGMCHGLVVGAPHLRSLDSTSHHCRKLFLPGLCLPWAFCVHPWGQELLLCPWGVGTRLMWVKTL